jgi:hypothetical protein
MAPPRPSPAESYSVKNGQIKNNVTPGVFFYWVSVTVPAGNNVFTVTETITTGNFTGPFNSLANGGNNVWNNSCNSVSNTITQNPTTGTVTVSFNAPVAGTYIISLKYDSKSIKGLPRSQPGNNRSLQLRNDGRAWFDSRARSDQKLIDRIEQTSSQSAVTLHRVAAFCFQARAPEHRSCSHRAVIGVTIMLAT